MARRLTDVYNSATHTPSTWSTSPSPLSSGSEDLVDVQRRVVAAWAAAGAHSEQTLARMGETTHRFARRLQAQGVASFSDVSPGHARGFIHAPVAGGTAPEIATQHARRTAIRTLYRTLRLLGYPVADPTLDLALPPRGLTVARPLTDDEVTLCRASAQVVTGRAAWVRVTAWALGEATAVSSEITRIRICDLNDAIRPTTVQLPGTKRHDPRTGTLTDWGQRILAARVQRLQEQGSVETALLAYGGTAPPGGAKAQASVCNALREVLIAGGLAAEPDVRPTSLRHWAGRAAYDRGLPLHEVALLLGHRSLDATADDIALSWHTPRPS
jgi:integrase/recombinase XerC